MSYQARRCSGRTSLTGPVRVSAGLAGTVLAGGFLLAGCSSAPAGPPPPPPPRPVRRCPAGRSTAAASPPPARPAASATLRKILVIMEENHSIQQIFPGGMPYLWSLAQRYAYATDWSDVAHPSLPNYLAIFAGSAFNDPQDCAPAPGCTLSGTIGFRAGSCPRQDGQGLRGIHAAAM